MARGKHVADFDPDIVVLYCQNCVSECAEVASASKGLSGFKPKVEVSHVLKLLDEGADGVQLVGCPENQCRFLTGSSMAEKRIGYARGLLEEICMGAERLGMERGTQLSATDLMELAERRAEAVRQLGPSPMKGAAFR